MARLTFKQFLNEESPEFVSHAHEIMPDRLTDMVDQNGNPVINPVTQKPFKVPNPERKKFTLRDYEKFPKSGGIEIDLRKIEGEDLKPDPNLKVQKSGGAAKERTLSRIGKPKSNEEFFGSGGQIFTVPWQIYSRPENIISGR